MTWFWTFPLVVWGLQNDYILGIWQLAHLCGWLQVTDLRLFCWFLFNDCHKKTKVIKSGLIMWVPQFTTVIPYDENSGLLYGLTIEKNLYIYNICQSCAVFSLLLTCVHFRKKPPIQYVRCEMEGCGTVLAHPRYLQVRIMFTSKGRKKRCPSLLSMNFFSFLLWTSLKNITTILWCSKF